MDLIANALSGQVVRSPFLISIVGVTIAIIIRPPDVGRG